MAQVKFKEEGSKIDFRGTRETITSLNLTWEKYQQLIAEFPQLKDLFIEVLEQPKAKKGE